MTAAGRRKHRPCRHRPAGGFPVDSGYFASRAMTLRRCARSSGREPGDIGRTRGRISDRPYQAGLPGRHGRHDALREMGAQAGGARRNRHPAAVEPGFPDRSGGSTSRARHHRRQDLQQRLTYTDFEHVLRAQGITHLLFSGCTTEMSACTRRCARLRPQISSV